MKIKARYIMIGGFLGAGKTTAVAALAQWLHIKGQKVGLITNDQGNELVDTALLRSKGFATEEIAGGCFCCRFNSLVDAAKNLTAATQPDIFIAEPVGSCTDLVATVTYPLRRIYGSDFTVAPVSILLDPIRAMRIYDLLEGSRFSPKVLYIYRKQVEEADIIVVNKVELLKIEEKERLQNALRALYPNKDIMFVSARTGEGLGDWFARLMDETQQAPAVMEIDYELYAEGEALLGWLNATVQISSTEEFDANAMLQELSSHLQNKLREAPAEIAHLKMTFSPDSGLGDIAVINLVRNDFVPELSIRLEQPVAAGQVIINLRAEGEPADLRAALESTLRDLQQHGVATLRLDHIENFRPGKPQPTHRFSTPENIFV